MTTYYYDLTYLNVVLRAPRALDLDAKLSTDFDIGIAQGYVSTTVVGTMLEVVYSAPLNSDQTNLLNNLVNIIIWDYVVGQMVFIEDPNTNNRRSIAVPSVPTVNQDQKSGYNIGSTIITTWGDIYTCVDNTLGAAVWRQTFHTPAIIKSTMSTTQVVPTATDAPLEFDVTNLQTGDISYNTSTYTVTINLEGIYEIYFKIAVTSGVAADLSSSGVRVYTNTTSLLDEYTGQNTALTTSNLFTGYSQYPFVIGDTINLNLNNLSGQSLTLTAGTPASSEWGIRRLA